MEIDLAKQNLVNLFEVYSKSFQNALNKHAPLCEKYVKNQVLKPWVDEEVLSERRTRRKLERRMLKCKNDKNKTEFNRQKNYVNNLTDSKKVLFFSSSISNKKGDKQALYQLIKRLSNKPTTPLYPDAPSDEQLANQFSAFFKEKIERINEHFPSNDMPQMPNNTRFEPF